MKAFISRFSPAGFILAWLCATLPHIQAQTTAFTYQGRLSAGNAAATGNYDFTFQLFDSANGTTAVPGTSTLTNLNVAVANGLFAAPLDFGAGAFTGTDRWLQIGVRTAGGSGGFNALSPRQQLTSTPYALFARSAGPSGQLNVASGSFSFVGGGQGNTNSAGFATISGGGNNTINGNNGQTIGGGESNAITSSGTNGENGDSTISGGRINLIQGANASTVGGGFENQILPATDGTQNFGATIGGGSYHVVRARDATIAGGYGNSANGVASSIGGGNNNSANGTYSSIVGGHNNSATGPTSAVAGGYQNTAGGDSAFVAAGHTNTASGAISFAAGENARAIHDGAFVWAGKGAGLTSTTSDEFSVKADGGVRIFSVGDLSAGVRLSHGSGSWSSLSDRNAKTNEALVQTREILEQLAKIPIQTWSYRAQDPSIRHIGPMAQDFATAFKVGEDGRHINTVDADGVALAAIQGLHQIVKEKDAKIEALEKRLEQLERAVSALAQK